MKELLLIQIDGRPYALDRDQVGDIRDAGSLHRLPLAPACIAGIALVDGRTVTLADLAVCLDQERSERDNGKIVMLKDANKVAGFLVNGQISSRSVPAHELLAMPEQLDSSLIRSCALIEGRPVPLLDLYRLSEQLLDPEQHLGPSRSLLPAVGRADRGAVRIVTIGNDMFAVSGQEAVATARASGPVTPLPHAPLFVRGVAVHDNYLLPVVDLSGWVNGTRTIDTGLMLPLSAATARFGLLIEEDLGPVQEERAVLSELPGLACSPGISKALLLGERIAPFLDLDVLLSPAAEAVQMQYDYAPDSAFSSQFLRTDVDVLEFSLLGARHALPKSEVEDIVPVQGYRALPKTMQIVVGVSRHQGTLLPVLDLGLMFGRPSQVTPDWSMIVLRNGDFRTLVLTERVFGERRLEQAVQRELPIMLPYPVIYGCYPDNAGVRLILNVMELTLHFEKAAVQDLLPSFAPDMRPEPSAAEARHESYHFRSEKSGQAADELPSSVETAVPSLVSGESDAGGADDPCMIQEPQPGGEGERAVIAQAEVSEHQETIAAEGTPEAYLADPVLTGENVASPHAEDRAETVTSAEAGVQAGGAESAGLPDVPEMGNEAREVIQEDGKEEVREEQTPSSYAPAKGSPDRSSLYAAVVVLLVLVAVLFLFRKDQRTGPGRSSPTVPVTTRRPLPEVKAQPEIKKPTLELEIPAGMPVAIDVYLVLEGDTLWSISERFTGDPYNYPKIAGENRIADPDLIFPGQKIRLIRK